MANPVVQIILKAINEASDVIDDIKDSFSGLGTGAEDAEKVTSDALGDMFDNAMDAFTGINQGVELAMKAFDALKLAYDGTVGKVLEIAGEVEEFVRISGDAPENMSALRLEAEKADVPFDDLYKAMANLNDNGVAPTLENLGKIAEEYGKLEDPIEKARYLTEQFGEYGDDIAPMLEGIAGGIAAVADSPLIFTEEELQAVKDHEEAAANLKLAWQGVAIAIGQEVIPVLTEVFTQISDSSTISILREQLNDVAEAARDAGQITDEEYNDIMLEAYDRSNTTAEAIEFLESTMGNLNETMDGAPPSFEEYRAQQNMLEVTATNTKLAISGMATEVYNGEIAMKNAGEAAAEAAGPIEEAGEAAGEAAGGMQAVADATNDADEAMKNYSERLLFKIASEGLSEDAALALAGAMGLVDQKTVAATQQVNFYQDLLAAGVITQAEYNLLVEQLATDLENVPEETPVEVTTNVEEVLDDLDDLATWRTKPIPVDVVVDDSKVRNWQPPSKTGTITYSPVKGGLYAAGGAIHAAASGLAASLSSYWVGERGPEPFFPAIDGRIVSNTQAMAALRGGAGANAREIANAVRDGVREAMRDERGGNVYNLTMPTSSNPADVRTAFELMEAWGA